MTHGTGWELFELPDGAPRLCHGDVGEVAAAAQALGELASGGSAVASGLNGLGVSAGTSGWEGTGADAFLNAWRTLVPPSVGLADTAELVSGAVSGWADQLADLQERADRLRDEAEQAHDELHAAEDAHDRALAHHASFGDQLADLWDRLALYQVSRPDQVEGVRAQIRSTEFQQEAARRATVQTGEAVDVATQRLAQLRADGVELATEHREAAQQVARTVRANTPSMSARVPFTVDGSTPSGEVETFIAALTDTFIARAMAELARTDPDLAAELEEDMQSAVAIIVAELPSQQDPGAAAQAADTLSDVGTVLGWITVGAAVVGGVVLIVGSGGAATGPVVTGLAGLTKVTGGLTMAAGAGEVVAGLAAGEGEHVVNGAIAIVTGKGAIPLIPSRVTGHLDDVVAGPARDLLEEGANSAVGLGGGAIILAPAPDATLEDIIAEVQALLPPAAPPSGPTPVPPAAPAGPPSRPLPPSPLLPQPFTTPPAGLPYPGETPADQLPPSVVLQAVQADHPEVQVVMPAIGVLDGPPQPLQGVRVVSLGPAAPPATVADPWSGGTLPRSSLGVTPDPSTPPPSAPRPALR